MIIGGDLDNGESGQGPPLRRDTGVWPEGGEGSSLHLICLSNSELPILAPEVLACFYSD